MDKNRAKSPDNRFLNFLTLLVLTGIVAVLSISVMIYINPSQSINPFPPPTIPAMVMLSTSTPIIQPSQTPSAAAVTATDNAISQSPSDLPTATIVSSIQSTERNSASVYAVPVTPSVFTSTADYSSVYRYQIQAEPAAISASLFDSSRSDCEWMGVAGQVHDLQGSPVTGILVVLGGSLDKRIQNQTTISGTARNYGVAGYEFTLSDHMIESKQSVWIQLVDQTYVPLSAKVYFDTFTDCDKNLIIINFNEVR